MAPPCIRCGGPHKARGLCHRCWKWADYHEVLPARTRMTPREKLVFARAGKSHDECWIWPGTRHESGYGLVRVGGVLQRAHRWVWTEEVGEIPEGLQLDHLCHNADDTCPGGNTCWHRPCVNFIRHLEPAPPGVNRARGKHISAIAHRTGVCGRGHKLVPRGKSGGLVCRVCEGDGRRRRAEAS